MADYLEHITQEGERFDLLAYRYYGNAYAYGAIVEANIAQIGVPPIFDSGLKLRIPVLPPAQATATNLPPWKRP